MGVNYFKWLCKDLENVPHEQNHDFLFVLPCVSQQLFENFFCAVFATEFSLIVRPLLNITKDVSCEVPFSDVKHAFSYQMVDGSPAVEIFLNSSLETLLLYFQLPVLNRKNYYLAGCIPKQVKLYHRRTPDRFQKTGVLNL